MKPEYHKISYGKESYKIACLHRNEKADLVFFIHGLGCSMESFSGAFHSRALAGYSLIAPDLPGFGRTPGPGKFTYRMEDHAEACLHLLEQFNPERVHLVAHSMGGAVALILARELGKKLRSLCNIEGNLITDDCTVSKKIASARSGNYRNVLLEQLRHFSGGTGNRSLKLWHDWVLMCSDEALNKSALSLVEWSCRGEMLDIFLGLKCRKCYIYGEFNSSLPVLGRLEGVERIGIEGSGHFPMTDNPGQLYHEIARVIMSSL